MTGMESGGRSRSGEMEEMRTLLLYESSVASMRSA